MQAWIGKKQVEHDVLTEGLIGRFRATLDSGATGDTAAQGIHWCLCLPNAPTSSLDTDGHPARGGFLPPIALPRRMWASSAMEFHAPITAGAQIERQSQIASIEEKTGTSGSLAFVTIDHRTFANGLLAVSEQQVIVYREPASGPAPAKGEGAPDLSAWQWHRALTPSATLLFRYSALTFNTHRIHYDAAYAIDEEAYRGLVVHGPLTATLLLDLAARELGDNCLKRFSFRGQSPAFAGEALHLVGRQDGPALTFAALGADGRTVMSAQGISG